MDLHFTQHESLYYHRHFILPEVGMEGQRRLKHAKVLYVGAGGLGSSALLYLAASGIGTLGIIDNDKIDISNLHRQILYSYNEIGHKKATASQTRLKSLNPFVNIIAYDEKLTDKNAIELIAQYDIIADGSDNFATRFVVNDASFHLKKPHVYTSISQFHGQCSVFTAENGPCFRCLFEEPPPENLIPNCADGGVLGVLPGIMGSIQAAEVIKLVLSIGNSLAGRLLLFNALEMQFRELGIEKNPECMLCKYHQPFDSLPHHNFEYCHSEKNHVDEISVEELYDSQLKNVELMLLDVRESFEYQICNLGGKLVPLRLLSNSIPELNKEQYIVVYCKNGYRSHQARDILKAHGFSRVYSLKGGIIEWINKINPTMMKY
ncbi:MAG: molybdopterin-synthase adenylyltransferase MoeB [Gammaproteobacteria bacterium]|nr:molybdopterin-synthase adenylyltransferase MoeB [Gammaproteobacteria bacterium]